MIVELSPSDEPMIRWRARLCFADLANEGAVILGHEGFLVYFTATFVGADCVLDLEPNDAISRVSAD